MANDLVPKSDVIGIARHLYKDVLQPSARRIGLSLDIVTKAALSPVALLDWAFEQSKDWLEGKIRERLARTPSEYVIEPSTNIAFTALSHIARSNDAPELRDIYAELLLKAMDSRAASSVHPAYFSIVEQLAPHEAVVLGALHALKREDLFSDKSSTDGAGSRGPTIETQFRVFCSSTLGREIDQADIWLTNLSRLGVLTVQASSEAVFQPEHGDRYGVHEARVLNFEHRLLSFTEFGKAFITACVPVGMDPPT